MSVQTHGSSMDAEKAVQWSHAFWSHDPGSPYTDGFCFLLILNTLLCIHSKYGNTSTAASMCTLITFPENIYQITTSPPPSCLNAGVFLPDNFFCSVADGAAAVRRVCVCACVCVPETEESSPFFSLFPSSCPSTLCCVCCRLSLWHTSNAWPTVRTMRMAWLWGDKDRDRKCDLCF